jgi:ATP-binding cassette subfamily B protein RaxB
MIKDYRLLQTEAAECGLACVAMAASLLGNTVDIATLRQATGTSERGTTFKELIDIGSSVGLAIRAVRCEVEALGDLKVPIILHWGFNHFVVLSRIGRGSAQIFDPSSGWSRVPIAEVERKFSGAAGEVTLLSPFQRTRERPPLRLISLIQWTPHIRGSLIQGGLLSILMLAHILVAPFFMQLTVDDAVLKGDLDFLGILAIGFATFALFNGVAEALRAIALQKVSSLLNWEMTQRLYHHLIRLPLPWFQRRRLADVLTRFQSLEPVRNLIANGWIGGLLDGVLAVFTAILMFVFSPKLSLIAAGAFLLYLVIRLLTIQINIRYAGKALTASIAEQGKRIETLRAIQTIKIMGGEAEREADWANRLAEVVRTSQNSALVSQTFSNVHKLINALALILTTYLGGRAIINSEMTVGVFYAITAYQTQFLLRAYNCTEQIFSWRMLELYLFRLSDVLMTPIEPGIDRINVGLPEVRGALHVDRVSFRYSARDPLVLNTVSLKAAPGELIALVGASGAGKSTLMKIMAGLYQPVSGDVRLDDLSLTQWGPRGVRQSMGVVLQDDELMSGSILENLTFFDANPDAVWAWRCLQMAALEEDIQKMPMRMETLIGDMGSSLSGGQKQRLILARALYRRPKILLLDEATSHLDLAAEQKINEALQALGVTRIIAAHRPETIASADRVYEVTVNGVKRVGGADSLAGAPAAKAAGDRRRRQRETGTI